MRLLIYEDQHWRRLRPLTDLLPVPALTFGASDLARRWIAAAALPLAAIEARAGAMACWDAVPEMDTRPLAADEPVMVVNAAAMPGAWCTAARAARTPALWVAGSRVVGAIAPANLLRGGLARGEDFESVLLSTGLPALAVEASVLEWPWQLVELNADAIRTDLAAASSRREGEVHASAVLEGAAPVVVEAGASVGPCAVLDAREGPILVARGARIAAHTVVTGPCVIGPGTQLLGGSVSQSTFGRECRIAGEVETCVWQGHGNKRHHGFVGHSAFGEWVNLGALTTTSDLKNNYGSVRVSIDGVVVDSRSSKVGSIVGAHVKTGIGTLLPTGAVVGTGANLFGGGRFAPKDTPSFAWWDGDSAATHELEKCIATARIAMGRRGRTMQPADEAALRRLFDSTAAERGPMTRVG